MTPTGTAVISGTTTGLGVGVAKRLAADGFRVVGFGHDRAGVDAINADLAGTGLDIRVEHADVRVADDVRRVVELAAGSGPPLRVVVNNAAIRTTGTVATTPEDVWDDTLDTNLKGTYLLSHFAIPHLAAAGGGSIVNISSISGHGGGRHAAYVTSKAAILALTRSMAFDHAADRIRVNAIACGFIDTPMGAPVLEGKPPEIVEYIKAAHPARKLMGPDDYAKIISFLVSDDADIISGALIDTGFVPGVFPDDALIFGS